MAPSEYIRKLEKGSDSTPPINTLSLHEYLRSHLINPEHLHTDNFEAFTEDRQAQFLRLIEQAMGKGAYAGTFNEEGEDVEYDES